MTEGRSGRKKVVLVGWNSVGWDAINPLLDRHELPNLGPFIEKGVMGTTATRGPLQTAIVAATVATGKHADKHGVLGPYEAHADGTVDRADGRARRVKAFWEILSQNGRRCNVVNFPVPGPAEGINGVFVSADSFLSVPRRRTDPIELPPDSILPADRTEDLKEFIVSLTEIDPQTMALFVPRLMDVDPKDPRPRIIATAIAQTVSVHAVATWLMANTEWDVLSVNYPAIEQLWGRFLWCAGPRPAWVDRAEFELFREVGASSIRLCDLLLGRLLELAGDDSAVVVYSARGHVPHDQVSRELLASSRSNRESLLRGEGIFAMRAAGVRQDELIHNVSSLDICPTVLHLAGLQPAADMDGRVLDEAFVEPLSEQEPIESWETVAPLREEAAGPRAYLPWTEAAGFAAPYSNRRGWRVQSDNDWNLVRTLLSSSRRELALPLLVRLYYGNPLQVDKATMIAEALYLAGQIPEALAVIQPIAESFPDSPAGKFMAGMIAFHQGKVYRALDFFEDASRDGAAFSQLFFYLGQVCTLIDRLPRAEAAYRRAVEINPTFCPGHIGLSDVLFRQEQFAASAEAALAAIGVDFTSVGGHIALGKALGEIGEMDRATQAFETALRFDPDNKTAEVHLAALAQGKVYQPPATSLTDGKPQAGELPAVPTETRKERLMATAEAVQQAHTEVAQWHGQYVEDLVAADGRLDEYLVANAGARGVEFVPAGDLDIGGRLREFEWTIRPPLPADQPALCRMFEDAFADAFNQEVFVMHPVATDDIHGAIKLSIADDAGQVIKLGLALRNMGDAPKPGGEEDFLMNRLLRAAVGRAAAGRTGRAVFMFSDDGRQRVIRQCLERLSFEPALTQAVYVMDGAAFRDRCLELVERYRQQKKIPDDIRLAPLGEVPWPKVDAFLRRRFADGAGAPVRELSPNVSRVMLKGDEVVAAFVGKRKDNETFLVTRLGVSDDLDGLWVTPRLLGDIAQAGLNDGHTRIELHTDEAKFPELVRIAKHMNAERGKTLYTMALEFAIPWRHEPAEQA